MNDMQTRFLNAAKTGAHVLADNTVVWDAVTARSDKHTALNNSLAALDLLLPDQETDHTGLAGNKKLLKLDAARKAALVAKPMAVFAKDTNNLPLLGEIDFELTDLIKVKDADAPARWKLVFDRATTNLAALAPYGVTAGQVTDIDTARTAFLNAVADPQAAQTHEIAVTIAIETEFKTLRSVVKDIMDMASVFKTTNATLWNALDEAFERNMSGVHHVMARITVRDFDTRVLLKHVKFTLSQAGVVKEVKHSTARGLVQLKDEDNGNYVFTSELDGYDTDVKTNMGLQDGKILDVEVLLKVKN